MTPLISLDAVTKLVAGLDHPEGLAVLSTGDVVAGGEAGQLYVIDTQGTVTTAGSTGGFALGLCVDAADNVFIADIGTKSVWTWSPSTSLVEFSTGAQERPLRHPNAMALTSHGLFVTDSGTWSQDDGTVHLISPDGSGRVVGDEFVKFPNGLAVSPDQQWLYVVESLLGITRAPILANGDLGPRELVRAMPGEVPDGLLFDGDGALLVTCYQPNSVYRLTVDGTWQLLLTDPLAQMLAMPTNGAWLHDGRLGLANLGGWHLAAVTTPLKPAPSAPTTFL